MLEKINKLISEEVLQKRINEIANNIENDYRNKEIVLVCLLKGAVYFAVDLSKKLKDVKMKLEFMQISSYGDNFQSSGDIELLLDVTADLDGKDVIIVEDIIDTGYTLDFVKKHLSKKNPKSLKICVLLDKKGRREINLDVDYTGFEIENKFVVGYGLDAEQNYRNLNMVEYILGHNIKKLLIVKLTKIEGERT